MSGNEAAQALRTARRQVRREVASIETEVLNQTGWRLSRRPWALVIIAVAAGTFWGTRAARLLLGASRKPRIRISRRGGA